MSISNDIKLAIERAAGQPATHFESVPIMETFKGQTVWEGIVEVYSLTTPPPERGYGWAVKSPDGTQYVAVLGNPPIVSPIAAVRAWIASQAKAS